MSEPLKVAIATGRVYTRRPGDDIGDGDRCPVEPEHGKMLTIRGTDRQYCPHQTHDGIWDKEGHRDPTRSGWPIQHISFAAAVTAWKETQHAV